MDETPVMMVTQVASSLAQPPRRGQRMTGHNISQPQTHQQRRRRRREPRDRIQCSMMADVARLIAASPTGANGLDPGSRFKDPERIRPEPPSDRTTEAGADTRLC